MISRRALLFAGSASLVGTQFDGNALAQTFPYRTIKIIVPSAAGGPSDIVARLAVDSLSKLGRPVIIENRPGAGGAIGAREAARSPPDGHTLMVGNTSTLAVLPATMTAVGYDPVTDFAPVAKFWESYQVLVTSPTLPPLSLRDFTSYAKEQAGKLNYAHGGNGGLPHLAMELFKSRAGVEMTGIAFRSDSEAITAVLGHSVHAAMPSLTVALPFIRDGKLRALGVTSSRRTPIAVDLPTVSEGGVIGFEVTPFFGIVAPAGTQKVIVDLLNARLNEDLKSADAQSLVANLGAITDIGSPERFASFLAEARKKWSAAARDAGFKAP